jgi:putative transposase
MEPGKSYHIYNRANGNESLFRSDENFRYFLQRYAHFITDVADTYAYCLMPNHIHFLVKIKSLAELEESFKYYSETSKVSKNLGGLSLEKRISQQFSNLFNSYTKAFNRMYCRLWKSICAQLQTERNL